MVKQAETDTGNRILAAAKDVFLEKGMHGARTQEIADKAGINKALLHYYFRTKQQLFEAVFRSAFMEMAPRLNSVLNGTGDLFEKIEKVCDMYIGFLQKQPYLPGFVLSELNRNHSFLAEIRDMHTPDLEPFMQQVEAEISAGRIRQIDPKQLFINTIALNIFPFVGAPLLKMFTQTDDDGFAELIRQRQSGVAQFIINAIRINP